MIDTDRLRKAIGFMAAEDTDGITALYEEPKDLARAMGEAINELEAQRKPTPCRFDVVAARAEIARVIAEWEDAFPHGAPHVAEASSDALLAMLDKALAAIDAGWSDAPVDIEGAALAAWDAGNARGVVGPWIEQDEHGREEWRVCIRAALAHVGRKVEPTIVTDAPQSSPMGAAPDLLASRGVTDAQVEEAAIRAWCAPTWEGLDGLRDRWEEQYECERKTRRNEARAVLEYAASLWTVSPAVDDVARDRDLARDHMQKVCDMLGAREGESLYSAAGRVLGELRGEVARLSTVDPRAERLTRYRCAAPDVLTLQGGIGHGWTDEQAAHRIEEIAHAMLAAERTPDRG